MTVFDLDELVLKNRRLTALTNLRYRKSDRLQWPVRFLKDEQFVELPAESSLTVGIKRTRNSSAYLALAASPAKTGTGSSAIYTFDLNINTEQVTYELSDKESIDCVLEVEVVTPSQRLTSQAIALAIERDVIGNELAPAQLPDLKATQIEAEAGTDNAKWMTPLRTAQAIAALGDGGGEFILKHSSFTAETGKAYLVAAQPGGGGYSGEGSGSEGAWIGSVETDLLIDLPLPASAGDCIVIIDALGLFRPTRFGQSVIPVSAKTNDVTRTRLDCSCLLTCSSDGTGWRVVPIEPRGIIDLGYRMRLDFGQSMPGTLSFTCTDNELFTRLRVANGSGALSIGMAAGYGPVIEASDNAALRIGQFPQPLKASGFVALDGSKIEVPLYGTDDCKLATYAGATVYGNGLEEGALRYNTVHGRPEILVKNPRPLTLTLTGTTHHFFANTFTLNGTYIWNDSGNRWNGNPLPTPYATKEAPIFQNWSGVLPAQIRYVNMTKWAIFVNNVEYAYLTWPGNPVYPPLVEQYPWIVWKLTATNEDTDFNLTYDTTAARWIALDGSGL